MALRAVIVTTVAALAISAMASAAVAASINTQMRSLRCSGEVVMVGDSAFALREKCGVPDWSEVVGVLEDELRLVDGEFPVWLERAGRQVRRVERWYYRGGAGRLSRRITIVGGELTNIEITGRD